MGGSSNAKLPTHSHLFPPTFPPIPHPRDAVDLHSCYRPTLQAVRSEHAADQRTARRTSLLGDAIELRYATSHQPFQLATDGYDQYARAVTVGLRDRVSYLQLIKVYGRPRDGEHRYSPTEVISTEWSQSWATPQSCSLNPATHFSGTTKFSTFRGLGDFGDRAARYSSRMRVAGLTPRARRAGIAEAAAPMKAIVAMAPRRTSGSRGLA
jgi:hypothetical protein